MDDCQFSYITTLKGTKEKRKRALIEEGEISSLICDK
jgi:hypothetical protein